MHPMSNTAIIESFAKREIHKKVRKIQCSTSLVQIVPSHPSVKYFPKAAQNFGMKQLTATTTATRHPDLQASTSLDGWDPKGAQEETMATGCNRLIWSLTSLTKHVLFCLTFKMFWSSSDG